MLSKLTMKIKNSSKGEIAALKVQLEAMNKGMIVSKPTTEVRYDFILDNGKEKLRTQVKYVGHKLYKESPNQLRLDFRQTGNNLTKPYTKEEIDLLLVYCMKIDKIVAFLPPDFHKKRTILINIKNPKSKYYYEKFLW